MNLIKYVAVIKDKSIDPIIEIDLDDKRYEDQLRRLLPHILEGSIHSYSWKASIIIHYINQGGFTYICITDPNYPKIGAFLFLYELIEKFQSDYDEEDASEVGKQLNEEFTKELYEIVQKIDQNPNSDLSKIPDGSADKVIGLLVEDISEVIEESHEKTHKANETVEEAAKLLAQPPRKQRWKLRKNVKSTILASTMIVLNIYFFSALICGGFSFKHCFK
ncbi:unnamed protein product [Blepharisma stoltei]|uniref:Longin domain-containing protein n=1 Tax=Blepharisma stoltei TaxID=1481888 RepID=A0AAU9JDR2_9CILI|nr:unnamed protein product [Blepharisma stoltei]